MRILAILLLLITQTAFAQKATLSSPNGKLKINVTATADKQTTFSIDYGKIRLIEDSPIGFEFEDGEFGTGLRMTKGKVAKVTDDYNLPVGKTSHVNCISRQMTLTLTDKSGRHVEMILRAFNDGVAFRYCLPEQKGMSNLAIHNENMDLKPSGNPKAKFLILPGFGTSHEEIYTTQQLSDIPEEGLIDMPALLEYPGGQYVAITESNVVDYAGMYLEKREGCLHTRLSPRLDKPELSVIGELPHRTPWRVFLISDRLGALIESNIITTLADPCKFCDTSWLKPGKTTFTWWDDFQIPDTTFQRGNNFESNKYYIDFVKNNGLQYHSIYGYANMPWYYDDGTDFGACGPNADVTKPDTHLNFEDICRYAHENGVGIHVWVNWKALYKNIDAAFDKFNEWGVNGMMVDFMDRDDQEMIAIQEEILRKAFEHHLFIQFHGACKPSGLSRTYPNEFTREGTLNYENYKWDNNHVMGADHDISMPFTRGLAGPADYHLGGFRAVPADQFKPCVSKPCVTSTRCHMLGMYMVLDNYVSMVCDAPEAYSGQLGFEFIQQVPVVWDETLAPLAELDEYCILAKRHGDEWFVGGIGSSKPHDLSLDLSFLGSGNYELTMFADAKDTDVNPNHLVKRKKTVTSTDTVNIHLAASGGVAMIIKTIQ